MDRQNEQVGTLPPVEKLEVVMPVPEGVMLELSSAMAAFELLLFCEVLSRLMLAKYPLIGVGEFTPLISVYAPETEFWETTPLTTMSVKTGVPGVPEQAP
jgi:hypothetical protein